MMINGVNYFPILNDPILRAIPWAAIEPHEAQAVRNHQQTLNQLAARGGLDVGEALAIMTGKTWGEIPKGISPEDRITLMALVAAATPPIEIAGQHVG